MERFDRTARRQVSMLTCLLCFGALGASDKVQEEFITAVISGVFAAPDRSFSTADTPIGLSLDATMTYRNLYHERLVRGNDLAKNICLNAQEYALTSSFTARTFGLRASFFSWETNGRISGEDYSVHGSLQQETAGFSAGGWIDYGLFRFITNVSSDIRAKKLLASPKRLLRHPLSLLQTPLLDLSAGSIFAIPLCTLILVYNNNTLYSGEVAIITPSKSAFRTIPALIDEHRVSLRMQGMHHWRGMEASVGYGRFGGPQELYRNGSMPVVVSGERVFLAGTCQRTNARIHPTISGSIEQAWFSAKGYDIQGDVYGSTKGGIYRNIGVTASVFPRRTTSAGIIGAHTTISGGSGTVFFYPFSNWLYLLDLPQGKKLYTATLKANEIGLFGEREFACGNRQHIDASLGLSGCVIDAYTRSATIDLLFGLLPDYRDEKLHKELWQLGIVKAEIKYVVLFDKYQANLAVQQLLPFELSAKKTTTALTPDNGASSRRTIYGGLTVKAGFTMML